MQRTTGHVYVVERQGGRQWYAKWRNAHGQHQKRLGPAWAKKTTLKTARGAPVWRTADGPKPTPEHLTPAEAEALLRELLVNTPDPATIEETRTFAEAAEAWYENGRLKRGLKRSTLRDYRLTLDLYVLPDLAQIPLAKLDRARLERWHDRFPYGRTAEKTLMIVRAVCSFAVRREWIDRNRARAHGGVPRRPDRSSTCGSPASCARACGRVGVHREAMNESIGIAANDW